MVAQTFTKWSFGSNQPLSTEFNGDNHNISLVLILYYSCI